jgi:hypothetical protein
MVELTLRKLFTAMTAFIELLLLDLLLPLERGRS